MTAEITVGDFSPDTDSSSAVVGLAKIHQANKDGPEEAKCSTTEAIMVALALCNRAYLPPGLANTHAGHLWWRLDDGQRRAVHLFASQMGEGGDAASASRRV